MEMSEVVYNDDAAGIDKTSKIQRVKPASKVAASISVEEQERGILPWVKSWCPSYPSLIYVSGSVFWYLSLPMPRRARTKQ